jgi:hypothetical protein
VPVREEEAAFEDEEGREGGEKAGLFRLRMNARSRGFEEWKVDAGW